MSNILNWIANNKWVMLPDALKAMVSIAQRNISAPINPEIFHKSDYKVDPNDASVLALREPKTLAPNIGERISGTMRSTLHGSVGVLPLLGPIFPRSNLLTSFSGGTSLEFFADDLAILMNNDHVKSIIIDVDSPGGNVTDTQAMADIIREASQIKPITAFVSGMAASGAYWISSAASKIYSAQTGIVGSIGVVWAIIDESEKDKKDGIQEIQIVSSISPKKRPDFKTEDGRKDLQKIVNDLGDIFAGAVAKNRNTTVENVVENYGQGSVKIAQDGLKTGMIDGISSLDLLIKSLNNSTLTQTPGGNMNIEQATAEDVQAKNPTLYKSIMSQADMTAARDEGFKAGVAHEHERILGIESLSTSDEDADIIAAGKADTTKSKGDVAIQIAEKQNVRNKAASAAHEKDAEELAKASEKLGSATQATGDEKVEATVSNMVAGANAKREARKRK